jgi:hypothetical protein
LKFEFEKSKASLKNVFMRTMLDNAPLGSYFLLTKKFQEFLQPYDKNLPEHYKQNQMEEYLDKVIEQAQDDDSNRAEATKIEGCRSS